MTLSVIIPVLNEAAVLPQTLQSLVALRARGVEIIVVDGGSEDATLEIVRSAGLAVLSAPRGRARQMNAGAAVASGDMLLFLHADTGLPARADAAVVAALTDDRHLWGRFDVRIAGRSPMLCVVACLMNLRSRLTGIATGDQAIFVARQTFATAGGFPDQALLEDIELCRRLLRMSRPKCLRERVVTSGRRWERGGVWRTIVLMWRIRWAYWRGRPASELARMYR